MANANADRNLLIGILAVQMDFISRDALIAAMNAWVLNKDKSLGQVLLDQGAVSRERHALLEALVGEHLKAHGGDAEKSLAAAGLAGPVRDALRRVADAEVHASIAALPPAGDRDATRAPSVGASTSSGLRFRILRPHARGGLGEVLVAEDEELHREVALKHIQEPIADHPESRARFLLEAEITGGLEHPGVVPVYGLGQYSDGRPYYAMRFIRGDSLRDVVARFHRAGGPAGGPEGHKIGLHELLTRFVAVCHAVAYAHSRGVLHRDLKPANVMLGEYGETLVVDWGLAKVMGRAEPESRMPPLTPHSSGSADAAATLPGQMVGTAAYMAPEQAHGRLDRIDERTDVYGLGAILFEVLTGRPPHPGNDVYEILKSALADPTPRARSVAPATPPALDAVCAKAMAADPAARYARALDLAADVQRFLADEPVRAWREPWRVRARRWVGRHRTLASTSAAAVAVAAVALAASTILLQQAYAREADAHHKEGVAHELAEQNYRRAREAVNRYFTEVSENDLLHEPRAKPVREKLLGYAREYDEQFVKERGDDPAARGDLARSLFRLALVAAEVDSEKKGIDLLRKAQPLFESLAAERPDDPAPRAALAGCYDHLGRLYRLTDQLADAEDAYKKALDAWRPPAGGEPDGEEQRAGLARSLVGLGNVYQTARRLRDAEDPYGRALALRKELSGAHPEVVAYRRDAALTQYDLGLVYHDRGEAGKAEDAYKAALDVQEPLGRPAAALEQYKTDLARTVYKRGQLHLETARYPEAVKEFRDAAGLWEQLELADPADLDYEMGRAEAYRGLADACYAADDLTGAEAAGKQCLEIRQGLAKDREAVPRRQGDLAQAQYFLGKLYRARGEADKAETALQEARRLQEPLAAQVADDLIYQSDLARTYNELGGLHLDVGEKTAQAGEELHKALDLWAPLAKAHADQPEFVEGLASCEYYLGEQARAADRTADAADWYGRALQALEAAGEPVRRRAVARSVLRNAHWKRAEALMKLGRNGEAVADWDAAATLTDGSDRERDWFRLNHARAQALAGDHAGASAEAEGLKARAGNVGDALYALAGVYSLCVASAEADSRLTPGERRAAEDGYAAQALDLLRQARAAGFFQDPANRARLKTDPDLEAVRRLPAFQAWLNET